MYTYDLHTHSHFSDGDLSPTELFKAAHEAGLAGCVLTDHNVTDGLAEARQTADRYGLKTCDGIEITSSAFELDVHLLGYAQSFNYTILKQGLKSTVEGYKQRVRDSISQLNAAGYTSITYDDVADKPGLPHSYYVAKIYAKKSGLPLKKTKPLVERGGPGYVPYGDWVLKPEAAVDLIHRAGGIAVLAHPGHLTKRTSRHDDQTHYDIKNLLHALITAGLDGIEFLSPRTTPEQREWFEKIIAPHDLLIFGGSDYHGSDHHPEISLGDGGVTENDWKKIDQALALHARS